MFLNFYKLREEPFGETPDPRFLYLSSTHREALASLAYGITAGRGFLALVADPGMGKTTLLYHLLEWLRGSARTAFLFQTQCDSADLLFSLLGDLGINADGRSSGWMQERLKEVLVSEAAVGRRLVLFIDEAQNLTESVLESVRLLSDFENSRSKLIQIVLSGQPQFADKLARPEVAQLRQRLSILTRLRPFTPLETEAYIDHRLRLAGADGRQLFTPEARAMVADCSRGVPRNINNLCFSALSLGFAMGKHEVDCAMVEEVASDLDLAPDVRVGRDLLQPDLVSDSPGRAPPPIVQPTSSTVEEPAPPTLELSDWSQTAPAVQRAVDGIAWLTGLLKKDAAGPATAESALSQCTGGAAPTPVEQGADARDRRDSEQFQTDPASPVLAPPASVQAASPQIELSNSTQPASRARWELKRVRSWAGSQVKGLASAAAARLHFRGSVTMTVAAAAILLSFLASFILLLRSNIAGSALLPSAAPVINEVASQPSVAGGAVQLIPSSLEAQKKLLRSNIAGSALLPNVAPVINEAASQPSVAGGAVKPIPSSSEAQKKNSAKASGRLRLSPESQPVSQMTPKAIELDAPPDLIGLPSAVSFEQIPEVLKQSSNTPFLLTSKSEDSGSGPLGGRVKAPRLVSSTLPIYPREARQSGVQGDVIIDAVIDVTGRPTKLKVVSGPAQLCRAALDSVRNWQYEPGQLSDKLVPVETPIVIVVQFRIP